MNMSFAFLCMNTFTSTMSHEMIFYDLFWFCDYFHLYYYHSGSVMYLNSSLVCGNIRFVV